MAYDPSTPYGANQDPWASQRNQAQQINQGQHQANADALQRRFASMGMSNSGAAIQAEQNNQRDSDQSLQNAEGNIGFEQAKQAVPFQLQSQQETFQGEQAQKQRDLQQQELEQKGSQFGQQLEFEKSQIPLKQRALDLEAQKMGQDEQAMLINEDLAKYQNQHSGGLFGGGGFLGTGI